MTPVNLYELTRVEDKDFIKFEAHLSQRGDLIENKKCEINSLKAFINRLEKYLDYEMLSNFYFSYTIPQISKEFDLLRIGKDYIINIELKSHIGNFEKVINQLIKNIFYLKHLERDIFSYTYDSETNTLYQLVDDKLEEIEFINLIENIKNQDNLFNKDINIFFKPSMFLVSPLNNAEKFLKHNYFLTSQQDEIKIEVIKNSENSYIAIKGEAGCGKTLLIYDIALDYAKQGQKICIIHCANLCDGQKLINFSSPLQIYPVKDYKIINYAQYEIIFIDEAQRMRKEQFDYVIEQSSVNKIKLLFSYDEKQMINRNELDTNMPYIIESLNKIKLYKLTSTIRINKELFTFINRIVYANYTNNKNDNIAIKYAPTESEALKIICTYMDKGYKFIAYTPSKYHLSSLNRYKNYTDQTSHSVIGQEFDNVIMYLDDYFFYKHDKLEAKKHDYDNYLLKNMFYQGVTRTREQLVLVIVGNKDLLENILSVLK